MTVEHALTRSPDNANFNRFTLIIVALVVQLVIIIVLFGVGFIFGDADSPQVMFLMDFVLAIISLAVGSVTSYLITKQESDSNLRQYALQAAEKVANIGYQLKRLAATMTMTATNIQQSNVGVDEKFIRLIEYLKGTVENVRLIESMNEGNFSDWRGIIGSELSQYEAATRQMDVVFRSYLTELSEMQHDPENAEMINTLVERIRQEFEQIAASSPIPVPQPTILVSSIECPYCHDSFETNIPNIDGYTRHIVCQSCGRKFPIHVIGGSIQIGRTKPIQPITQECPECGTPLEFRVNRLGHQWFLSTCNSCGKKLQVIATDGNIIDCYIANFNHVIKCPNCQEDISATVKTPYEDTQVLSCQHCDHKLRVVFNRHKVQAISLIDLMTS